MGRFLIVLTAIVVLLLQLACGSNRIDNQTGFASIGGRVSDLPLDLGDSGLIELEEGDCVKTVYSAGTSITNDGVFEFTDVPYGNYTLVVWGANPVVGAEAGGKPVEFEYRAEQYRTDISVELNAEKAEAWRDISILRAEPVDNPPSGDPSVFDGRAINAGSRVYVGPKKEMPRRDGVVAGYLIQDLNDDGACGPGDRGVSTLVQLLQGSGNTYPMMVRQLMTDYDGRFEFTGVPPGPYRVAVWYSPGIVSVVGTEGPLAERYDPDAGMSEVDITVATQGTTDPSQLIVLVKRKPAGLLPYPVAAGNGSSRVPVGGVGIQPSPDQ